MKKRKKILLLGIILLIISFGIGYAYLTTTLTINGVTDVDSNTWNVYWDNPQVTTGSVSASTPTIDTSKTSVSFSVNLHQPGDFYEFTVDAINTGSIDAMIDTFTKSTVPNYINYLVTYNDERDLYSKHYLKANKTETIKIRVEYKNDIDASDLPQTAETLNISFGVTYVQADTTAQPRLTYQEIPRFMDSDQNITENLEEVTEDNYITITYGNGEIIRLDYNTKRNGKLYTFIGYDGGAHYAQNVDTIRTLCADNAGTITVNSNSVQCVYEEEYERMIVKNDGSFSTIGLIEGSIKSDGTYYFIGTID